VLLEITVGVNKYMASFLTTKLISETKRQSCTSVACAYMVVDISCQQTFTELAILVNNKYYNGITIIDIVNKGSKL